MSKTGTTGRRAGLDRDDMVAVALRLVESEGPASLTMRRLATELDVTTTTIYWHVGSRDELVVEIIRRQSERQATLPVVGTTPRERVLSAARNVWNSALENPAITSLAHQTGTTSLLEHPLEIAMVREIEAAGLTGPEAAAALRAILTTLGGFLVRALRRESSIPEERRKPALWAATRADLDSTTIAALTAPFDLDALFDATIQVLVDHHIPLSTTPPSPRRH